MEEAEEILRAFIRDAEKLPSTTETYYLRKNYHLLREDEEPVLEKEFREKFLSIAPARDEKGYIKAEVSKWAER